ncbi:glycerate kinase, partial [Bacillus sp. SIMBA_008]|uniref:glycerate kinase n=2 Tax=unclassified Bacillus (in: firmicutes) TaxID=185979 RepID=UPI00397AA739
GRYDGQSEAGKAPAHVAQLAREAGVPVALVAGAIQADTSAFAAAASLTEIAGSTEAALKDPLRWLRDAGEILAR